MPFSPESFAAMLRSLPDAVATDSLDEAKKEIGEMFRSAQEQNFVREEDESGVVWPRRVGEEDYTWPILRKSLKMISAATKLGAPGNITSAEHRRLILGIRDTDVHYAKYHQSSRLPRKKLPRRQFFYLRKQDRPQLRLPIRSRLFAILEIRKRVHRG